MARDILIVEDVKESLDTFGELVKLHLGIEPFLTQENPEQALEILKLYPIKVLITNQIMPNMYGPELVKKIKNDLHLKIPCILLTGFIGTIDASEAVNLDFFRLIDKGDAAADLIPTIQSALIKYDINAQANSFLELNELIFRKKDLIAFNNEIKVYLIRISSIHDKIKSENDWSTEYIAQRNVKTEHEIIIKRTVSSSIESGYNTEQIMDIGSNILSLIGLLTAKVQSRVSLSIKELYENKIEIQAKYKIEINDLTDAPLEDGSILVSREYQTAPVFTRINLFLKTECSCCNISRNFNLSIDLPSDIIALRQIEHFQNGKKRIIQTESLKGSISKKID